MGIRKGLAVSKGTFTVRLRKPHLEQGRAIESPIKFKVIRAGRRGGKTVGAAQYAVKRFLKQRRVLYAVPTGDQAEAFWNEVNWALEEPINAGIYEVNRVHKTISLVRQTKSAAKVIQRIKAKTAWNADTLRGDFADDLILDEWQLMNEDAWHIVGHPMVMQNDGDAMFIYTPPSLHSRSMSKAKDKRHAAKMFKEAKMLMEQALREGKVPEWGIFTWRSMDNPSLSRAGLARVAEHMSSLAYRQEILAEDVDEVPGALWTREIIEKSRVRIVPTLDRIAVGVDPPGGSTECGIVAVGVGQCSCRGPAEIHGFVLDDSSKEGSPDVWVKLVVRSFRTNDADYVIAETNFGGDMVKHTVKTEDATVRVKETHASRGKALRAEPVSALSEQGKIHFVGSFPELEDELCQWIPGEGGPSPNRLDAFVHAANDLMVKNQTEPASTGELLYTIRDSEFYPMPLLSDLRDN